MGKRAKGGLPKPLKDMTMQTLGAGSKKSRDQMRFEQATKDAVQTLARRDLPIQDLADVIRRCLNNMHGPEWHCLVGRVKAFIMNVRYWRGKFFLFEGGGLRIIVFQSAPPALEGNAPTQGQDQEQPPRQDTSDRTSIKVLRSEMEPSYQKRVLATASAAAKVAGKDGDVEPIVASIKASLTEATGPVWHVVATRGAGEWSFSVAYEPGQLLDFKLNGHRFLVWKHAQAPPGLMDIFTSKRISSCLFMVTLGLLCLYIKTQSSCDACCSSSPTKRARARCEPRSDVAAEGVAAEEERGCSEDATDAADQCLRNATILFFATCGIMAAATALKWSDRSKYKHKLL